MLDIARVVDFQPNDPRQFHVRAALRMFQRVTSLKVDLPLAELEVAHEDMEVFMSDHLQEISSQKESRDLIGELSKKLSDHSGRIKELMQTPKLAIGDVCQWVTLE